MIIALYQRRLNSLWQHYPVMKARIWSAEPKYFAMLAVHGEFSAHNPRRNFFDASKTLETTYRIRPFQPVTTDGAENALQHWQRITHVSHHPGSIIATYAYALWQPDPGRGISGLLRPGLFLQLGPKLLLH